MAISTMYPKYSKKTDGATVIMEQKLLKKVSHLRLDTAKCSGCGICSEVCPQEAIILGLVGAVCRGAVKGGSPVSIDPAKCSYCGICTILCPFGALDLEVDGQPSLPVLEQEGFPQYSITAEIDENKCVRCTTCSEVCPHDAIVREVPVYEGTSPEGEKRQSALTTEISFVVDTEKCTVCGICATLCPALRIERIPFNARDPKSSGEVVWTTELCNACRVCSDACPHDAITVQRAAAADKPTLPGKVSIDKDLCITCTWCKQVCPTEAVTIKKFFDGEIVFNAAKCPGGCSTCVEICPCHAIYLPSPIPARFLKRDSIEPTIAVNTDLCILCGACVNACPSEDVITIHRTGIHVTGPETDLYKTIAAKLFIPRTSRLQEDTFGQVELKKLE